MTTKPAKCLSENAYHEAQAKLNDKYSALNVSQAKLKSRCPHHKDSRLFVLQNSSGYAPKGSWNYKCSCCGLITNNAMIHGNV